MKSRGGGWLRRIVLALMLAAMLAVTTSGGAQAQDYDGLDILFLVDQSGSMGGAAFGYAGEPNPRDPLGLRFEVLSYALETLTEYQAVVPQDTDFRMAVVYFGDNALPVLDWTTIGDGASWPAQADVIKQQLSADSFRRHLDNTNFLGAFQQAQQLFTQLPPGENHLRVIVVLTDGAPCAPDLFRDRNCTTQSDQDDHMLSLIGLAGSTFPAPQYQIYTIAIDANNTYWPHFQIYWNQVVGTTGSAQRVEDGPQIGQRFLEILADSVQTMRTGALGSDGSVIGESIPIVNQTATIVVPPYDQLMRLTIFKLQPDTQISLTDSRGNAINEGSPNVTIAGRGGSIETWSIANPEPGRWLLTTSDASRSNVSLDLIRVTWRLIPPPEPLNRYIPVPLQLELVDADGRPLPVYQDPAYALDVTLTAFLPNGLTDVLTLTPNGIGTYAADFVPTQQGEYRFDLLAMTQNVDGSPLQVFNYSDVLTFQVSSLTLDATLEPEGDVLVSQTVDVTAQLLDSEGNPVFLPDARVELNLMSSTGNTTFDVVADAGQSYRTTLAMDQAGQFQIRLRALLPGENGDTILDEKVFNPFRVQPAAFVLLRLLQPETMSEFLTTGFPPTTPVDTVIEVQAVNDSGEIVDLPALAGGSVPVNLTITNDQDSTTQTLAFAPTSTVGTYRAIIPDLPSGSYTLLVAADTSVRLANSTLFDPRAFNQTIRLTRATNPALIALIVISGLIVALVIGGIVFFLLRRRALAAHPALGKLELFREPYDESDVPLATIRLDKERKNLVRVNKPVPGVKRIEVKCPNQAMSTARQVFVSVETETGLVLNSTMFAPHDDRFFTAGRENELEYRLVKDRDADYGL